MYVYMYIYIYLHMWLKFIENSNEWMKSSVTMFICNYESEAPAARMWCGQDWKAKNSCKMHRWIVVIVFIFWTWIGIYIYIEVWTLYFNSGLEKNIMDWKNQLWIVYPLTINIPPIEPWTIPLSHPITVFWLAN